MASPFTNGQDLTMFILKEVNAEQVEECVQLLMVSFEEDFDTEMGILAGGSRDCAAMLFRASIKAAILEGTAYVLGSSTLGLVSIGVCFGPGTSLFQSEQQRAVGWYDFMNAIPPESKAWWEEVYMPRSYDLVNSSIGVEKCADSWWFDLIATHPHHRKKGYSSAIIKEVCKEASIRSKAVALSTHNVKNVPFYQNLGFNLVGHAAMDTVNGTLPSYVFLIENS